MNDTSWRPLSGILVADFTRYLPGPFASRELLRHGARVVRLEAPEGDPLRQMVPSWHRALNAGKESVVCDLKADAELGRAICSRADVVLEGFRPGVAARLGVGPADLPETVIYCSITGFGPHHRLADRAGHDLNYLGFAGALADTAPALPPLPLADLAAGALSALNAILLALYDRTRTGRGRHLSISMTHQAHHLVSYRLGKEGVARPLTGGLACYRIYATSDGRFLTVAALEPKFFRRLCDLLHHPELKDLQFDIAAQDTLSAVLGDIFRKRTLREWLTHFGGEDAAVGPVNTLAEGEASFADPAPDVEPAELGEHTARWRAALGL